MQSKTSLFSVAVFRNNLTRFWPLWLTYFLIWFFVLPFRLLVRIPTSDADYTLFLVTGGVLSSALNGGTIISFGAAGIAAMSVWSFAYNHRSTSMYASLPVSRTAIFITNIVTILGVFLSANVLVFLLALIVELAYGVLMIGYLLQWLAIASMILIFFVGFAVLCAMLTGNIIVMPTVYLVLSFTSVVVMTILNSIFSEFVFGYVRSYPDIVMYLSPFVAMFEFVGIYHGNTNAEGVYTSAHITGWGTLAVYCGVGILLLGIAFVLFKKRRMESAGDTVAIPILKPVFKYCLSFGCALVVCSLLYPVFSEYSWFSGGTSVVLKMCALMILGAFAGWFAGEMLIRKSLRVFKKGWLGFGIVSLAVVVVMFAAEFDIFGYEKSLPDADEVKSISIYSEDVRGLDKPELIQEVILMHGKIIDSKNELRTYENTGERWIDIEYVLESGEIFARSYRLPYDMDAKLEDQAEPVKTIQQTFNSRKFVDAYIEPILDADISDFYTSNLDYLYLADSDFYDYQNIWFTQAEAYELIMDCVIPDLQDGNMLLSTLGSNEEINSVYVCTLNVDIAVDDDRERMKFFYFTPSVNSSRTIEWLREYGIELLLNPNYDEYGEFIATSSDIVSYN